MRRSYNCSIFMPKHKVPWDESISDKKRERLWNGIESKKGGRTEGDVKRRRRGGGSNFISLKKKRNGLGKKTPV